MYIYPQLIFIHIHQSFRVQYTLLLIRRCKHLLVVVYESLSCTTGSVERNSYVSAPCPVVICGPHLLPLIIKLIIVMTMLILLILTYEASHATNALSRHLSVGSEHRRQYIIVTGVSQMGSLVIICPTFVRAKYYTPETTKENNFSLSLYIYIYIDR